MQAALEGQILLRPALLLPVTAHVEPDLLADTHRPKQAGLQTFDLQTMSLILVDFRRQASVAGAMNTQATTLPKARDLTSSQIGKIGETLAASQLMLASGGRLSPFLPLADDDGVDLVLLDKVTSAALTIQVKSRTRVDNKKAQTVEFNVRLATFSSRPNAYILNLLLDEAGQGIQTAWLVPTTEVEQVANRKPDKLVLVASAKPTSNDRHTPYRCTSFTEVCRHLIDRLDRSAATQVIVP